jgi:hypothetical protein
MFPPMSHEDDNPYEHAALEAVENHPLRGEDVDSNYPEDAEHWIQVYNELLAFKHALLTEAHERVATMQPEGVEEVERTDLLVMQAEADRFRRRLDMWEKRRDELAAAKRQTG